jgi:elongation factor G
MGVPVNVGKPLVAYREAITKVAQAKGSFIRQTATQRQYAVVTLRVEPFEPQEDGRTFEFVDALPTGAIKQSHVAAVERGVHDAMQMGVLAGYELLNVRATLVDAQEQDADSTELAFETAARIAFEDALKDAGPVMLEPMMKLEVSVPDEHFGSVSGDLSMRRGLIQDTEVQSRYRVIHAMVPLAEVFQYATKLRTLTQGRASYAMQPSSYEPMPPALERELLRRYGYTE